MCGIAGIFNLNSVPVDSRLLHRMTARMAHRGPDGEGVFTEGALGLGHRRLRIIDLSERGKQPLSNEDGTVWITFNGEIYNFKELKEEYPGLKWSTNSDTEVIIKLFQYLIVL